MTPVTTTTAALEARIDALEKALSVQAIILGQCLTRPLGSTQHQDLFEWLTELRQKLDSDPVPEMHNRIVSALVMSVATLLDPTPESLRGEL